MHGGFVYGRFFSDGPGPPYGYRIESVPEADCAEIPGISRHEASRRYSGGHACFSFIEGGNRLFFWLGRGGACRAGRYERSLSEGSPYIYGITRLPEDGTILKNMLLCAENMLRGEGLGKLLLCSEKKLSPRHLSLAGLNVIARYSSTSPKLLCHPHEPPVPLAQLAAETLRQRMPGLSSLASGLLSASPLRKYLIRGSISGRNFTIIFNGPLSMANYYSGVLFGQQGRYNIAPVFRGGLAGGHGVDVKMEWRINGAGKKPESAVLPSFSRAVLGVGPSFDEYVKSLGESAQKDIKKIKKNGLSQVLSHDLLDFMLFYLTMYRPMVSSRHGKHSLYVGFNELLSYFCSGFLIFIMKKTLPVAALLAIPCGKTLVGKTMGIRAGSSEHTHAGANSAIIYYHIKNAYELGYDAIDFGYSSPFGCDGVLKFKSKWLVKTVADRNTDLLCLRFRNEEVKQTFFSACSPLLLEKLDAYDPPELTS